MTEDLTNNPAELVALMTEPSRSTRQEAAHALAQIARETPDALADVLDQMIDALDRPEAQTRWEVLDALSLMAAAGQDVSGAFDRAETSLFDERSLRVCLAAFRYMSAYGSTSEEASDQAWPLMSEALQCYHGDTIYRDMLMALLEFARGTVSDDVRASMAELVAFDAENGSGYLKTLSADVLEACSAS